MEFLKEKVIQCPYCGESIVVLVNEEEAGQEYIEDCQICCKPIIFNIELDLNGQLKVCVRSENETW